MGRGKDVEGLSKRNAQAQATRLGVTGSLGVPIGKTLGQMPLYGTWEDMHIDILLCELGEEHELRPRIALTEAVHDKPRTFRSDATARGSARFRAFGSPRSRLLASVAVQWSALTSPDGAQPHDSGRFPDGAIHVSSHVIHHSVVLDAIMMG
ncbi:hypothetical protein [uncultured Microbacterium sp.]|uniref:hypothetical protein n=1 Tax=uncultured Microbacterium sp. TaxID=191216 RepID=UPI0025D09C29|nr:hypothetical protein [uncultured Microbacterium sp.]